METQADFLVESNQTLSLHAISTPYEYEGKTGSIVLLIDITRTVLVGPHISDEIRKMYTLVLKSHIALATVCFPKGTSGLQIDAIARRPLWDCGFDFAHGTGTPECG